MFRGGDCDTLSGYQFNYKGTVSAMQKAAKSAGKTKNKQTNKKTSKQTNKSHTKLNFHSGKTLPDSFYLIDISTFGVHSGHDVYRNVNEYNYFAANKVNNHKKKNILHFLSLFSLFINFFLFLFIYFFFFYFLFTTEPWYLFALGSLWRGR